jgi:hypothetical protein
MRNHRVSLKDGVILRGGGNGRGSVEGEVGLVEDDVMGDNDCGWRGRGTIPLVIRRVPKEDAMSGAKQWWRD